MRISFSKLVCMANNLIEIGTTTTLLPKSESAVGGTWNLIELPSRNSVITLLDVSGFIYTANRFHGDSPMDNLGCW